MLKIFDNIIYFLQKSGGGSVYWNEITKDYYGEKDSLFIEQDTKCSNIFRKEMEISNKVIDNKKNLKIQRYLPVLYKETEKHIFHSSYYRYSKNKNAVNITTVHDFTYEKYFKGLAKIVHYLQKRKAIKKSDGIICVSENTKRDLLSYHPWALKKEIKVIYNGVSEQFKNIKNEFNIEGYKYNDIIKKKYILFVGHRSSYKNFNIAVKTVNLLDSSYSFVIVGQELNKFENELLEKEIKGRYVHLKNINSEDLNILYNYAFCFLYPSSYEGFGIPILEAMKTGCPVVTTNSSSIPEVAGEAALIVKEIKEENFAKSIESLENKVKREEIIANGYEQAKNFSWDKCRKETKDFYEYIFNMKVKNVK